MLRRMPKGDLSSILTASIQRSQRATLVNVICQHPEVTLGELVSDRDHGKLAAGLKIGELLGGRSANVGTQQSVRPGSGRPGSTLAVRAGKGVETRTQAGRDRYDASVLAYLKAAGRPVSAGEARKALRGSAVQFRASIERLISAKKATWSGQTTATRYSAT